MLIADSREKLQETINIIDRHNQHHQRGSKGFAYYPKEKECMSVRKTKNHYFIQSV